MGFVILWNPPCPPANPSLVTAVRMPAPSFGLTTMESGLLPATPLWQSRKINCAASSGSIRPGNDFIWKCRQELADGLRRQEYHQWSQCIRDRDAKGVQSHSHPGVAHWRNGARFASRPGWNLGKTSKHLSKRFEPLGLQFCVKTVPLTRSHTDDECVRFFPFGNRGFSLRFIWELTTAPARNTNMERFIPEQAHVPALCTFA